MYTISCNFLGSIRLEAKHVRFFPLNIHIWKTTSKLLLEDTKAGICKVKAVFNRCKVMSHGNQLNQSIWL